MSTQISYRKGTAAQNDAFTGALAEITVDTTNKTLRVHDGATQGGSNIATVSYVDNSIASLSANSITDGTSSVVILTTNGNIRANVGGSTVQLLSSGGANVTGYLTASGNVTGDYILGNGSQLTGIDATSIQNGTANVRTFLDGNVTISAAGTANVAVITGTGANIDGTLNATGNITGGNLNTAGLIAATGNITGGNLSGTSIVGTLTTAAQTNITSVGTLTSLAVTGNITGGNLITAGLVSLSSITKTGSNGVGNIGSSTSVFDTVFAKATSAQYADVAERYLADADYPVGTVLVFGGDQEVTQSQIDHGTAIAGTVSDQPAYVMNSTLEGDHVVTVALLGRVPVRVIGTIRPGDLLVASELPGIATGLARDRYVPGCVIGKALESYDSQREGVIEAVVGRL